MYSLSSSGALRAVPTRLVLVAGLHVAAIWALINGLHHVPDSLPRDMQGTLIPSDPTPTEPPVRQETPKLQTGHAITEVPPIVDPILDPILVEPPRNADPVLPLPTGAGAITSVPTPMTAPVVTGAAVDPRHPLTQPPYPPGAIRGDEQGALNLSILVGTDGRVRDVKVAESSGSSRLDQAAISEARSHWRLRPATRDGVPFEQWLTLRVVFRLENR